MNKETRRRLQNVKNGMMARCYSKNNPKYKNYGARGVTVDSKWWKIDGFVEDVTQMDTWNEKEFLLGNLQLDKDLKIKGNKLYSKDTCMWVSPKENISVKPSYQKPFIAINIYGERYRFSSFAEMNKQGFSGDLHWDKSSMIHVLQGRSPYCSNWYAYYENNKPVYPTVYKADKDGETYISFKQSVVERRIGAPASSVYKALNVKKHSEWKGWEISCYPLKVIE